MNARTMKKKKLPKRLRREESFLGIHFDFHADEKCTQVGKNVTPAMVEYIVKKVKPDHIQCDMGTRLSSFCLRVNANLLLYVSGLNNGCPKNFFLRSR